MLTASLLKGSRASLTFSIGEKRRPFVGAGMVGSEFRNLANFPFVRSGDLDQLVKQEIVIARL